MATSQSAETGSSTAMMDVDSMTSQVIDSLHIPILTSHWRIGANQPSHPTGTIFPLFLSSWCCRY